MSIDPNDIKVDLTKFYKTAPEDPATGEPRVGDPNNVKVDLTKFYKTSKATPEDPATGEPQDEKPIYYRSRAKSVIMDDGRSVEDAINDLEDNLENHTHEASEIITDKDHQFVTEEEKQNWTLGARYNNDEPIYQEHGGIKLGTTFVDKTVQEMFDMILYPHLAPTISCQVTQPSNGGVFETGTTVNVTKIRVTANSKSNKLKSITIMNGSTQVLSKTSGLGKGGTFDFSTAVAVKSNTTFTGKVVDDIDDTASANTGTFTFVYPIYHGSYDGDSAPTETEIKAMTKHVETKGTKSYQFNLTNTRACFAYPKAYGALNAIYDQNNFNVTNTFTRYEANLVCADGKTVVYYVYTNNRSTVSNFTNKFQW